MSEPFPNSANRFVNPSLLPDVNEGFYATDYFRMYCCKVLKCPYDGNLHSWSQCPFTHTDERARRRDPEKYLYKHTPCSNFTCNMSCKYGDQCRNAHGEYEKGLHPDFYRTKRCLVPRPCTRPICFFAHTQEELRRPSSSLSAYSRKPAPCHVPDFPSTPVNEQPLPPQPSLSESPSTIAISNNAPDYTLEGLSSNEQSILSRPNLSADSPRPETSFSSNMEDGFRGKHYHTFYKSRKQKKSMLSPSRTDFSPRNVNHSLSQPLIGVTTEPASPTNYQVSMPALQATQPQQTPSPSSSNLVFNISAADNSDDRYKTCYGPKPDLDWVDELLYESDE